MTAPTRYRATAVALPSRPSTVVLDILAIAAGVAAVVLALAVSHSATHLQRSAAYGLDPSVVSVSGTAAGASGIQQGLPTSSLTSDDAVALGSRAFVPDAVASAPTVGLHTQVEALSRTASTDVIGSTESLGAVLGYTLAQGRFISPIDVQDAVPVVVLGQTVVNALFAGTNPLGQYVTIDNQEFQVVGTLRPLGFSGTYDRDDLAVVPITTAQSTLGDGQPDLINQVLLRAAKPSLAGRVANEVSTTLLRRHDILNPGEADFTVEDQPQLASGPVHDALAVRRILELAAVALLLSGAAHLNSLAQRQVTRWRRRSRNTVGLTRLTRALAVGMVASVAGLVLAVVLVPYVRTVGPGLRDTQVTVYGLLVGIGAGLVTAAVSLISLPRVAPRRLRPAPPRHRAGAALEAGASASPAEVGPGRPA